MLGHTLIQWVIRIRFKEQILKSDHNGVQVQNWLPVFSEDVQANISLEIYVGVVNLYGVDGWVT